MKRATVGTLCKRRMTVSQCRPVAVRDRRDFEVNPKRRTTEGSSRKCRLWSLTTDENRKEFTLKQKYDGSHLIVIPGKWSGIVTSVQRSGPLPTVIALTLVTHAQYTTHK
ncbi:hypothetical protein CBL_04224 [Carabus blaptoides fortunei]